MSGADAALRRTRERQLTLCRVLQSGTNPNGKQDGVLIQPYFESGFPFGRHQWISAAATAGATQAIARTLPDARPSTSRQ